MRDFFLAADGWCRGATRYDSPYFGARAHGIAIDLLVIHNISLPAGRFGGPHVADLFSGRLDYAADPSFAILRGLTVSAHFFIRRCGRVMQFVSGNECAWHAGASAFDGRLQCNQFSIGIEMEGCDFAPFTPAQYASLTELTLALRRRYPLAAVRGHEHIAPGRKTDPGPFFDWARYQADLEGNSASALPVPPQKPLQFPSKS